MTKLETSDSRMPSRRAKVLFVSYISEWTGPTISLLLLLRRLRRDFDVAVLMPGRGPFSEALEQEGISYFSLGSLTKWSIPAIFQLIRRERFDLVYGNTTHSGSKNAFLVAKLNGLPFMCHVRSMEPDLSWRTAGHLRLADAVVAISEASADVVSTIVRQERLHVVHNGVEPPINGTEPDATPLEAGARSEAGTVQTTIVNVGHVCPRKGQKYAVEAMAEVVKEAPATQLILAGYVNRDEGYVREIRELVQRNGLEDNVTIVGFQEDVWRLLHDADIFLHTAVEEAHGRSVLEAMACGLPTVAFAADGVVESVVDGETGFLVPVGDVGGLVYGILKLINDRSLRSQLGKNGRHRIDEFFSADVTARRVGHIMDQTLKAAEARRSAGLLRFLSRSR